MRSYPLLLSVILALPACGRIDEPSAGGKPVSFWKKEARQVSLMTFWNSDKDERRREGFRRLSEIGEPAVPTLVELLEENRRPVSGDAFNALANLGPRAASAIPAMRNLLTNENKDLQRQAAWILGTIGPAAEPAVPDLERLLRLTDARLRETAAEALGKIGGAGHVALERALSSRDPGSREAGMTGMAVQPLDLKSRRLLIAKGLADESPIVRGKTVKLFLPVKREDAEAMAEYLVKALDDSDPQVKRAAQAMLTTYMQGHRATPRFLATVLSAGDQAARADAAWRLVDGEIPDEGTQRDSIVDKALLAALSDTESKVRVYAARALLSAGGARSARAARVLRHELSSLEPILRVRAARALWDMDQRVDDVREAYRAGLVDPQNWNRVETISAIGHMGVEGKAFIPDLERLLLDPDPEVRDRATKNLYSIRLSIAIAKSRI